MLNEDVESGAACRLAWLFASDNHLFGVSIEDLKAAIKALSAMFQSVSK